MFDQDENKKKYLLFWIMHPTPIWVRYPKEKYLKCSFSISLSSVRSSRSSFMKLAG